MEDQRIISGKNEQEVWPLIEANLKTDEFTYDVLIEQNGKRIQLYIDIDPGGGFEGGSEYTQLKSPLPVNNDFRFAIHHQGFIDSVGKFFGMQDVDTGYPEFDKSVLVETNDKEKVHQLFADADVREIFSTLEDFNLGIHTHHVEDSEVSHPWLEFYTDVAIDDTEQLRLIYHGFCKILQRLHD
ncbi:hypothetical protein [Mucilaginibacter polytrichastri]|uniref:Uncharacterized protein n=1 Tax=Mucilaginibacter polytrichastri TaxID=1302689 RepID=A0A1Q6A3F4_9SPHI|nr:hypothetical protein [Mucilaginibacter polytrichastri]OKS88536.1 hypothetical protein RG47T_4005 [Mucilaginibacter polytrichastri]SFT11763.1 hypothetical protein SAMN04487890_11185 [Mucilaginibacter polytrichastri]